MNQYVNWGDWGDALVSSTSNLNPEQQIWSTDTNAYTWWARSPSHPLAYVQTSTGGYVSDDVLDKLHDIFFPMTDQESEEETACKKITKEDVDALL